jgi:hypothetical protein
MEQRLVQLNVQSGTKILFKAVRFSLSFRDGTNYLRRPHTTAPAATRCWQRLRCMFGPLLPRVCIMSGFFRALLLAMYVCVGLLGASNICVSLCVHGVV